MKNKKIISLIPNLLTSLALLMGLLAIFNLYQFPIDSQNLFSNSKSFWWSCSFIYAAAFLDFVDGKIARLLNQDSEFGMHYDSFSDLISFGLAPSLLAYNVYLFQFEKFGLICCIFYILCVALRLARFNTLDHDEKENYFIGLPSPMAAGLIVSIILISFKFNFTLDVTSPLLLLIIPLSGLLMVGNVIFIKKLPNRNISRFNFLIIISILSLGILTNIEIGSFIFFYFYLFFSFFKYFVFKLKKKSKEIKNS